MTRVTVIGLGSPFGADRVGWEVAERLAASARVTELGAAVQVCAAPGGELPGLLAGAEAAILVDAVRAGGLRGTIYRLWRPDPALLAEGRVSSHGLSVRSAMELLQALGEGPQVWLLYGIDLGGGGAGEPVSDPLVPAVVRVTEAIVHEIAGWRVAAGK